MQVTWVFRYFWFLGAAFMLVNVLIWRRRLPTLVSRGAITGDEAAQFTRVALAGLCGASLLLGAIALAAGWSDPFCGQGLSFTDLPHIATSTVIVGVWVALLAWVWMGSGADLLGRIVPALGRDPEWAPRYSPATVRLAVTALVAISAVAGYLQRRPLGPGMPRGCAFQQAAS